MAIEVQVNRNGAYWQGSWVDANGKRHKCGLGARAEVSKRQANKRAADLAAKFAKKPGLAAAGKSPALAPYIQAYIDGRADLGPGSVYNLGLAGRYLRAHFGDEIRLDEITRDQARAWRGRLARGELIAKVRELGDQAAAEDREAEAAEVERARPSETTVCNMTKYAKAIFAQAATDEIIPFNPFDKLSSTAPNVEKDWGYLTRADFEKLIGACPSPGWKCVIALCRLAGLRRSEAVALPWSGVDWDKRRLTVYATKTKRAASGGKRVIPIEPRLYEILLAAFGAAESGAVRVCAMSGENLLRDFDVIRRRAEVEELAEPFQTMRRNREQDWSHEVPTNTLSDWMGHGIEVAAKFYLRTDAAVFARVSNPTPPATAEPVKSGNP